jgi:hypothetical protein
MAIVIVERNHPDAVDLSRFKAGVDRAQACFDLHGVRLVQSYIAPDRQRMICVYEAADAESVRIANRQAGAPFDRVWTATTLEEVPAV